MSGLEDMKSQYGRDIGYHLRSNAGPIFEWRVLTPDLTEDQAMDFNTLPGNGANDSPASTRLGTPDGP